MPKFQKKPVVIEAIQFNFAPQTAIDIIAMAGPEWEKSLTFDENGVHIETLEGTMTGGNGDYIIKGIKGELYPCKPDVFEATYEAPGHDLSKRDDLLSAACPLMESLDRMSPYTYLLITSTEARLVQEEQFALNPKYATSVHRPVNE